MTLVLAAALAIIAMSTATAATQGKVKLTLNTWLAGREPYEGMFREIIQGFQAQHPDVEIEHTGAGTDKLKLLFAAGTGPDVAALRAQSFGPALIDLAVDITQLMERDRVDPASFKPGSMTIVHINGRYYGFPFTPGNAMMYVNKTMISEAGADVPGKGWTLGDLRALSVKTTRDRDGDGETDQWGYRCGHGNQTHYYWPYLNGGQVMDRRTGELTLMDERVISALQWFVDLRWEHNVVDTAGGYIDRFMDGKVTFMDLWEGPRSVFLSENLHESFQWGIIHLPKGEGPALNFTLVHPMIISRQSRHIPLAWQFLKYYGSYEAQKVFAEAGFYPMTRETIELMITETQLPAGYDTYDLFGPLVDPAEASASHPFHIPGFVEVWQEVEKASSRALNENMAVRLAFEEALPVINAALEKAR